MKRVYISGPLTTSGSVGANVRAAVDAGTAVQDAGHAAYIPHLNYFGWEVIHPRPYEYWIAGDLAWVAVCDALIRLPGRSKGANREVQEALKHNIPVYYSVAEFLRAVKVEETFLLHDLTSLTGQVS
jgi:hypothetical protein